ncbi:hypothetical protein AMELA_G00095000 [Ameiurus melas]|uniref:Endonuclease/exonuclease/phosphatase domain-containing protein n=1 Tax=Ameiurus melas TaxID=219545 RepID=A0A7J6AXK0_AMEME|nr:hypothetical protein AMELA_G00095000 [Ameiurus melas]
MLRTLPHQLPWPLTLTGQLGKFIDEFDTLLSTIPDDGTPLLVLGDFKIHLDKPHAADFLALLPTFDLKQFTTPATHKAGKQLDLILTRNCTTHNLLITPLHTSDHFFIQFSISLPSPPSLSPPSISFHRNLRSLFPSHFSSIVTTLLPSNSHLSSLDLNTTTDQHCPCHLCIHSLCLIQGEHFRKTVNVFACHSRETSVDMRATGSLF